MDIDQLEARMKAEALRFVGLDAVVKFDFGAQGALFVDGKANPPRVSRDGGAADTTLKISLEDFVKLNEGKLSPILAFSTGRLKVQGNMGVAMKLSSMLED